MSEVSAESYRGDQHFIRHRLPGSIRIVICTVMVIVIFSSYVTAFVARQYIFAAVAFIIFSCLCAFLYFNHSGYRIRWSEEFVCMRGWGFRDFLFRRRHYQCLCCDDIATVEGETPDGGFRPSYPMADQVLRLVPFDGSNPEILLFASGLNSSDLAVFLTFLNERRPGIIPQETLACLR